jgi:phosphoribosyl 1,2-cyclic phosphate phosphodiesterase
MLPRVQLRMMRIAPGVAFELGDGLRGQAFDVEHGRERTFGYRFTGGRGETLVYVPDVSAAPSSRLARDADLLMLDGSCRGQVSRGHLPIEQAIPAARTLRARRVLFTHIGHRAGLHAELDAWLPEGFGVAYDGQQIDLEPAERPARRGSHRLSFMRAPAWRAPPPRRARTPAG